LLLLLGVVSSETMLLLHLLPRVCRGGVKPWVTAHTTVERGSAVPSTPAHWQGLAIVLGLGVASCHGLACGRRMHVVLLLSSDVLLASWM
jgi:hypothetical protein